MKIVEEKEETIAERNIVMDAVMIDCAAEHLKKRLMADQFSLKYIACLQSSVGCYLMLYIYFGFAGYDIAWWYYLRHSFHIEFVNIAIYI